VTWNIARTQAAGQPQWKDIPPAGLEISFLPGTLGH